ncbi:predicted protein [Aspergillus nidulans FGSC A4]|uniref:Uncharacterized protein n=1 Tax=Emericella nidulans (strain FGSC A4 / ATCC 38163 / CBS 112.46 / NRRL 194 / M139) TaxID=227321 RepID=Q5AQU9_EMENI|nr:hypothetical protein [Aspergillus nidulans FGSC A4]EAA66398.1 predicted protein [Aspergillus nidulans FGSC A4]CBF87417.1 TPA: conserved hypothetical protein [Aspergillus nidulans FGSC A4]|eukprot:XP_682600.1 predicted protein [Aspergillus nidulans FGSC A4]
MSTTNVRPSTASHFLHNSESSLENTTKLLIEEEPPSNTEWAILCDHFTSTCELEINSGFNEDLNDKHMPVQWPLERLVLSAKIQYLSRQSDIQLTNMSQLGKEWMAKKNNASCLTENSPREPKAKPITSGGSHLLSKEPSTLSGLYANFPPNPTNRHFRGHVLLCESDLWKEWALFGSNLIIYQASIAFLYAICTSIRRDAGGHLEELVDWTELKNSYSPFQCSVR